MDERELEYGIALTRRIFVEQAVRVTTRSLDHEEGKYYRVWSSHTGVEREAGKPLSICYINSRKVTRLMVLSIATSTVRRAVSLQKMLQLL